MGPVRKYGRVKQHQQLFEIEPLLDSPPHANTTPSVHDLTIQLENVVIDEQKPWPQQRRQPSQSVRTTGSQEESRRSRRRKVPPQATVKLAKVDHIIRASSRAVIGDTDEPPELDQPNLSSDESDSSALSSHSIFNQYTSPLLALTADADNQTCLMSFCDWSRSIEKHFNIVKIAEASYSEVYRLVLKRAHPILTSSDESVLKLIPLAPETNTSKRKTSAQKKKESFMSSISHVAAEIKLLQHMRDIPGFTNFRDVRVLQGRPSEAFAQAWTKYTDDRPCAEESVWPDPSQESSYDAEQLWAVIEMQDAGIDLEHVHLPNVFVVWDVFWSVTLAIAKGEQLAEFEHRDLHMGNICVKPSREDNGLHVSHPKIRNLRANINFTGIESTIIDYTLSRAHILSDEHLDAASGHVEYTDLEQDPALFTGDATYEYQYEIYRYMRSALYYSSAVEPWNKRKALSTGRTWAGFHPQTNLVWLHLILHKMLHASSFIWPSRSMANSLQPLQTTDSATKKLARTKAKLLETRLRALVRKLSIDQIPSHRLASAVDLVKFAFEAGWLDEHDIRGESDTSFSTLTDC